MRIAILAWLGSPAHAGMDLCIDAVLSSETAAPPPTRGWTRAAAILYGHRAPPPTRGWTRAHVHNAPCTRGLPRPRGDGPTDRAPRWIGITLAPPPTRGWTVARTGRRRLAQ